VVCWTPHVVHYTFYGTTPTHFTRGCTFLHLTLRYHHDHVVGWCTHHGWTLPHHTLHTAFTRYTCGLLRLFGSVLHYTSIPVTQDVPGYTHVQFTTLPVHVTPFYATYHAHTHTVDCQHVIPTHTTRVTLHGSCLTTPTRRHAAHAVTQHRGCGPLYGVTHTHTHNWLTLIHTHVTHVDIYRYALTTHTCLPTHFPLHVCTHTLVVECLRLFGGWSC